MGIFDRILGREEKGTPRATQPNTVEGFKGNGAIVVRDDRGKRKQEIPNVDTKAEVLSDDPMAIYKPSGSKHVDAAKALGNNTGWTYAAVNAIASEVANIQWRLYKITEKDHEEQDEHELLDLLESVNEHMTGIELKYMTMAHLELAGNCYWYLEGVKDDMGKPTSIHLLNPGRVRVKLNKNKFPWSIDHYEFTIDGKVMRFEPYEILHLKYPDPSDPYVGLGIPQAIPVWIDSDNYAMEYNRKFFLNGAAIGLYLATQTNIEGQIDRIRRSFNDKYAGNENAHKIPVFPKGVEMKSTGSSQRDMDFAKLTETTRDRILAAFRVSKTILGTAESDTNRATAETADYVFSKRTIKPKMLLVTSFINERLVPRYGDDIYLTFIDPVPEDKAARTTEMKEAVGGMPVITQNEARKNFMGLGGIEGGDKLMSPTSMQETGKTGKLDGEVQTPALARSLTASGRYSKSIRVRTGGKTAHSAAYKTRVALGKAFQKALETKEVGDDHKIKSVKDLTREEYMEHYKRFTKRTDEAIETLEKTFKAVNKKQKEVVIENLPKVTGVKKAKAVEKALADLFNMKEWVQIVVDLATPTLESLTKDEAIAAFSMIGVESVNILAKDPIKNALEAGISKMAESYNQTTLDQLKTVLGEKMTQDGGTNLAELTDAVQGVYDFADEKRAYRVAATESSRTANWANKTAWQESGVVKSLKWYTGEDATVCEFCHEQDGKVIPITTNFFDAGDTIMGSDGGEMDADYGPVGAPPLHPNCRCYTRPEEISID